MSEIKSISGYLYYTCVQKPVPCVDEEKGKEYKVAIVVSQEFADEYEDAFTKVSIKKVRTTEFESQYKTEPPEEFADNKFQYVITVRKNTLLANGEPVPSIYLPKVLIKKKGKLVDVTHETLVGNGSKGAVSLDIYSTDKGKYPGTYPRLKNVLVEELVEYVAAERSDPNVDPVFGEFESDAVPTDKEFETSKPASKKQEDKPKASSKPKAKPAEDSGDDDDAPF